MKVDNTKPWVFQGRGVVAPYSPSEIDKSLRMYASEVNMRHIKGKDPAVTGRYFEILHRVHTQINAGKIHTRQEVDDAFDVKIPVLAGHESAGDHTNLEGDSSKSTSDHAVASASDDSGRSKKKRAS